MIHFLYKEVKVIKDDSLEGVCEIKPLIHSYQNWTRPDSSTSSTGNRTLNRSDK